MDVTAANARAVALQVFCWFFAGLGLELDETAGPGRFYTWRVRITDRDGQHVGLIELGGENCRRADGTYTARIELTGTGCGVVSAARCGHAKRWLELRAKLESCAGRLTRIDVAADDLLGKYPLKLAQSWYASGEFDNRGQRPKAQTVDDHDSGDGKTFMSAARSQRSSSAFTRRAGNRVTRRLNGCATRRSSAPPTARNCRLICCVIRLAICSARTRF